MMIYCFKLDTLATPAGQNSVNTTQTLFAKNAAHKPIADVLLKA